MGTYLIATDEAGYGPKLGPLVIAGSIWFLPSIDGVNDDLSAAFDQLTQRISLDGLTVQVDDSKRVYQPGKGLDSLECMVGAGVRYCGIETNDLMELIKELSPRDYDSVAGVPWLSLAKRKSTSGESDETQADLLNPFLRHVSNCIDRESELMKRWFGDDLKLIRLGARVVPACKFNQVCEKGYNKSDLLSMLTLDLVADLIEGVPKEMPLSIFCDRHGGRRYYASVLQDRLSEGLVRVVRESKEISVYELSRDRSMRIQFAVKGDRFPPVAYSSLVAKYLRERLMERMNSYFSSRVRSPLKPTAGYPVDAERFLQDIEEVRSSEKISDRDLIRER